MCRTRTRPHTANGWCGLYVVCGFTEPEGSRKGIGALLLGEHNAAQELVFCGKVGTGRGFTAEYLTEVRRGLELLPCFS